MFIIRSKDCGEIIHIDYSALYDGAKPNEIYADYNESVMEFGWTKMSYIPADFKISRTGEIVELSIEEQLEKGVKLLGDNQKIIDGGIINMTLQEICDEDESYLDVIKGNMINYYSSESFIKRKEIIPDYKLENCALGLYDNETILSYKKTVQAFREEFYRVKSEIESAATLKEIEAATAEFPKHIVDLKEK